MFRPRPSLFRSVLAALVALVLLGTLGLAPAGALPVRQQATWGLPRAVLLPASPVGPGPTTAPFADVDAGHDFYRQISWLAEAGVSTGWSGHDGTRLFRPYQPVLRDQMAAFLHRLDPLLPGRSVPTADVVGGYETAYAVRTDGRVWAWSGNYAGQLGNGTTTNSSVPVQVAGLSGVETLATDGSATFAITADGTVRAWGRNQLGQLGDGTTTDSAVPVPVRRING